MWGRLFRIPLVTVALVGALTTKFYGCDGPTNYSEVAKSHERMFERSTSQVAGSLESCTQYLLLAASIGAIAFGIHYALHPTGSESTDNGTRQE